MSFVCGLAFALLINVSAIRPVDHTQESPVGREGRAWTLEISGTTGMPKWVTRIPENHFVGISKVCQSIEEARQGALDSAIGQILQAMGAEYTLNHKSILTGNENHAHHNLNEKLTYSAKWFIRSIQQTVIESNIQEVGDGYVCFVLLNFPPAKTKKLRQLSIGPKVGAGVLKMTTDGIWIEVRENNGVQVTLTDYQIEISTENRHADLITLFAWKVPKHSFRSFRRILDRKISIKNNSQTFLIRKPLSDAAFKNFILGTKTRVSIVLRGYDEIGRKMSFPVSIL